MMIKRDRQATIDKQFLDPRSYVTLDGREVLYGEDWKARKKELWERCQGRCEWHTLWRGQAWNRCLNDADDPHHIIPRSKGRNDILDNLQALCRFHHDLLDERKIGGRHHASKD